MKGCIIQGIGLILFLIGLAGCHTTEGAIMALLGALMVAFGNKNDWTVEKYK